MPTRRHNDEGYNVSTKRRAAGSLTPSAINTDIAITGAGNYEHRKLLKRFSTGQALLTSRIIVPFDRRIQTAFLSFAF